MGVRRQNTECWPLATSTTPKSSCVSSGVRTRLIPTPRGVCVCVCIRVPVSLLIRSFTILGNRLALEAIWRGSVSCGISEDQQLEWPVLQSSRDPLPLAQATRAMRDLLAANPVSGSGFRALARLFGQGCVTVDEATRLCCARLDYQVS